MGEKRRVRMGSQVICEKHWTDSWAMAVSIRTVNLGLLRPRALGFCNHRCGISRNGEGCTIGGEGGAVDGNLCTQHSGHGRGLNC